ncbi:MAG TPA: hypothetical protein PK677_10940 [Acidiphilium sp.]|jgi:hypothetical protein|nr:hypothetical protein [Acidiphilium sp.]
MPKIPHRPENSNDIPNWPTPPDEIYEAAAAREIETPPASDHSEGDAQ